MDQNSPIPIDDDLIDLLPIAVAVCRPDGRLTRCNARAAEVWGRSPALGSRGERYTGAFRLWTPAGEPLPRHKSPMARALRTNREVSNVDVVVERPDGSRVTVAVTASPLHDAAGALTGGVSVLREVSERRRAEERERMLLRASTLLGASLDHDEVMRQLARAPLPNYADWCVIQVIDEDGRLQGVAGSHVSPEREDLVVAFLRSPAALRDITASVLLTGESALREVVPPVHAGGDPADSGSAELLRALEPESMIVAALVARGRIFGLIVFVLSGSGRRYGPADLPFAEAMGRRAALAIDNARLYRESQQANRLKDEFLATLSHELRTPLNAVLGWTQLLLTHQLDEADADRALKTIRRNAEAQARLIGDILDVSRIITGKLRLNVRPTNVAGVVEAAVESVRPAAEAREIALVVSPVPADFRMLGDPDRLQQILWNLLSNAVKFTPRGGRVELIVRTDGASVEMAVADNGAGIRPEFLSSLFERFRQADSSTTRVHGGLGLGLAIVRHLVELHGGNVRGESRGEGFGATFTVTLPVHTPASPAIGLDRARGAQLSPGQGQALSGVSVLVVDDDRDSRQLTRTVLERGGARVEDVGSVDAAVAALGRSWPTVLVADIGMPGRDGYDLIALVREMELERGHRLRAIALTAYAADGDRRRALMSGFDLYLAKPATPDVVTAAVARLVEL